MRIVLITPAAPGSKAGNRATAERWAALLQQAGHQVTIATEYHDQPCNLFIALHAWRSHDAIRQFRDDHPDTPLITVLTGTDIYFHQHRYPEPTLESMALSDCLIGLHRLVSRDIPAQFHSKLVTVLQSADATPPMTGDRAASGCFDVCVIGHLRDEKDSLRAATAARHLPPESAIRVVNAGKPHTETWQQQALQEQAENPRFQWLGELDKPEIQGLMARSRVMVISSVMEGGANVVSEACRAGLPIIASDISGNRGLLGDDYPGYFPARDDRALAELLLKAEGSPEFLAQLRTRVAALSRCFTPQAEQAALLSAVQQARLRHGG